MGRRFGIEPDWEKVEEALGEINESEWGRLFGTVPEMEIEPEKEKGTSIEIEPEKEKGTPMDVEPEPSKKHMIVHFVSEIDSTIYS